MHIILKLIFNVHTMAYKSIMSARRGIDGIRSIIYTLITRNSGIIAHTLLHHPMKWRPSSESSGDPVWKGGGHIFSAYALL